MDFNDKSSIWISFIEEKGNQGSKVEAGKEDPLAEHQQPMREGKREAY